MVIYFLILIGTTIEEHNDFIYVGPKVFTMVLSYNLVSMCNHPGIVRSIFTLIFAKGPGDRSYQDSTARGVLPGHHPKAEFNHNPEEGQAE